MQVTATDAELEALRTRVAALETELAAANKKIEEDRQASAATARRPFGYVVELRRDQPWPGIRWRRSRVIASRDEAEWCASEWLKQVEGWKFMSGSTTEIIPVYAGFPADIVFVANDVGTQLKKTARCSASILEPLLPHLKEAVSASCDAYRTPPKVASRRSIRLALRRS
ncbi:hypothetical protein [Rhizobium sp. BK176]|uniref:hypothetical protein n=1 Tax=Rhizobium sp. BK176 TaxID=2587071 RepID=UPI0021691174|nr:hypothetical protein [Rhizobium sp. BK176]MCS4089091.1 hypothetical protein [Rhizobium sp. BK176]